MPMVPFYTRFHDLAFREMRTITLAEDTRGVPKGEYALLELYCNEDGCDCRRVHLQVVTRPPNSRVMANINFGWEDAAFYSRWGSPPGEDVRGPFLDPLNPQSRYAAALLKLVREWVLSDEAYVERLARHYALFKSVESRKGRKGRKWVSRTQVETAYFRVVAASGLRRGRPAPMASSKRL